jgi:hypothetical protein
MDECWAHFVQNFNESSQYSISFSQSQTISFNEISSHYVSFITEIFCFTIISQVFNKIFVFLPVAVLAEPWNLKYILDRSIYMMVMLSVVIQSVVVPGVVAPPFKTGTKTLKENSWKNE